MKNFNDVYEAIYRECAVPMEEMRKGARNGLIKATIVSLLIGIGIAVAMDNPGGIIYGIGILIIYAAISRKNSKYNRFFKDKVIKTFVKEYNENLEYVPERGVAPRIYDEGEFEWYDRYHSEDLITGTLEDGYRIYMSEVHTEKEYRDEDGHRRYSTVFRGLFAKIEFDKIVNSHIRIRRNGQIILGKNSGKIEMDSGEFERKFNVYATDKIIAMQLLTADIMQMFLGFKEQNKMTPEITLKGTTMYIRFATKDLFEASVLKNSLDYDLLKKYYDTINFTLKLTEGMLKNIKETEI